MRGLLWQINCVWLGRTIAFYQCIFSSRGGWLWANVVSVPRKVTPELPGWLFFDTVPRPHFLGPTLIWPSYFGEHVLGFFGVRVCQGLWDSFLYLGKLHWFLYLLLFYFYDPGMFIFRWSSNFVEKVVLKGSMAAKMASRVSYLVYYYCI